MIYLFVFLALIMVVGAMSIGVMFGRKPIAGSCGGMAALGMETSCDICGGDKSICEDETKKQLRITYLKNAAKLGVDATVNNEKD